MVVTPLGTQTGALEVEVWADNWLSALRAARKEQGEDGGVPPGASCAMSESGVVTILDARNRRRFVLSPAPTAGASEPASPGEAAPSSPAPEPTAQTSATAAGGAPEPSVPAAATEAAEAVAPAAVEQVSAPPASDAPSPAASAPGSSQALSAQSSGSAPRDPLEPSGLPPPAAVGAPAAPARVASSPTLPPVGLAAIRAAAQRVQTQPPEPAQAKSADETVTQPAANTDDAPPGEPPNEAKVAASAPTTVATSDAPRDLASRSAEPAPATTASSAASDTQAERAQVAADTTRTAAESEDESTLEDDDFAWESARASVAEVDPWESARASVSEVVGPPSSMPAGAAPAASAGSDAPKPDDRPFPEDRSSPRAKQTRAYSPQRAEALRREFETSRALAGANVGASSKPPAADVSAEPRTSTSDLPRPSLRAVPPVPPAAAFTQGTASASSAPGSTSPGLGRGQESRPASAGSEQSPAIGGSESPAARVSVPRVSHPQGLVLLVSRDAEPTPEAPLTYRERSYWVAPSSDHARLEALLQAEYITLRRELLTHPRGQLIHLAAFDHAFDDQPTRAPLATLEWKDWRGTAVFSVTMEPEEGEERSAVLERPPSQRPLESEWPLPAGSRVRDQVSGKASPASNWPVPASHRAPQPRRSVPRTESKVPPRSVTPPATPKSPVDSSWPPVASANGASSWPAMPTGSSSFPAASSTREPTGEVDHRLAAAFEAMPELYFLSTPVAGLEFTIELLTTLVACEAVSGCLYDINTDEFRFVALSGAGAAARRASAVASQAGLFGVAKRAPAEALVVAKPADDTRFDPQVDGREGLEVRSLVYLPVRFGGQLLGMLQLINRTKDVGFTPADVSVLTYVSTQLAEFLLSRRTL